TVEESKTQSPGQTKSAVVSRAPAESNNDFGSPAPGCIQDHLSDPKRRRAHWIVLGFLQAPHACGFAHLNHGKLTIRDQRVTTFDLSPKWIVRRASNP